MPHSEIVIVAITTVRDYEVKLHFIRHDWRSDLKPNLTFLGNGRDWHLPCLRSIALANVPNCCEPPERPLPFPNSASQGADVRGFGCPPLRPHLVEHQ